MSLLQHLTPTLSLKPALGEDDLRGSSAGHLARLGFANPANCGHQQLLLFNHCLFVHQLHDSIIGGVSMEDILDL